MIFPLKSIHVSIVLCFASPLFHTQTLVLYLQGRTAAMYAAEAGRKECLSQIIKTVSKESLELVDFFVRSSYLTLRTYFNTYISVIFPLKPIHVSIASVSRIPSFTRKPSFYIYSWVELQRCTRQKQA